MAKIRKLKSGAYQIRVYLGKDSNGKIIQKSISGMDKRRVLSEAAMYADAHRTASGTLSAAVSAYISRKEGTLSPSTIKAYRSMESCLKAKYEDVMRLPVQSIGKRDLQEIVDGLMAAGKTPKTVRNFIGLISGAMAKEGYRIPPVELPQQNRKDIDVITEEEFRAIMAAAKGTRLWVPLSLAFLGLRRSEICGAEVKDMDGDRLHVQTAIVEGPDNLLHKKGTKTAASDRWILLPHEVAEEIRANGYIFHGTPKSLSCAFDRFLRSNGFRHVRLHDCRHFFASYAHNIAHLSDAQIMALGGWSTPAVLDRVYRHAMQEEAAAAKVIEGLF